MLTEGKFPSSASPASLVSSSASSPSYSTVQGDSEPHTTRGRETVLTSSADSGLLSSPVPSSDDLDFLPFLPALSLLDLWRSAQAGEVVFSVIHAKQTTACTSANTLTSLGLGNRLEKEYNKCELKAKNSCPGQSAPPTQNTSFHPQTWDTKLHPLGTQGSTHLARVHRGQQELKNPFHLFVL